MASMSARSRLSMVARNSAAPCIFRNAREAPLQEIVQRRRVRRARAGRRIIASAERISGFSHVDVEAGADLADQTDLPLARRPVARPPIGARNTRRR